MVSLDMLYQTLNSIHFVFTFITLDRNVITEATGHWTEAANHNNLVIYILILPIKASGYYLTGRVRVSLTFVFSLGFTYHLLASIAFILFSLSFNSFYLN